MHEASEQPSHAGVGEHCEPLPLEQDRFTVIGLKHFTELGHKRPVGPLPDGPCDAIARGGPEGPMAATSNVTIESVPLAVIPTIDPSALNPTCAGSASLAATNSAELLGWLSRVVELAGAMAVD
jgi:hypothetical protein